MRFLLKIAEVIGQNRNRESPVRSTFGVRVEGTAQSVGRLLRKQSEDVARLAAVRAELARAATKVHVMEEATFPLIAGTAALLDVRV